MPQVSVIVPTRDRWERIDRTVVSVLRQLAVDLELIVVDDGSRDAEGLDALRLRLDDNRVRGVRLERSSGAASARNTGLAEAHGPWVAFLDDDDLWAPDKLAGQLQVATAMSAVGVYSGVVVADDALNPIRVIAPPQPDTLAADLLRSNRIPAGSSNLLIARDVLERLGGFDESLVHLPDWDAWIRLARAGPLAVVPDVTVAYVQHGGNRGALDPGGVFADLESLEVRYGAEATETGVSMDHAEITRWLAASARRGGRRLVAARLYWLSARRDRDLGNLARAVHAALALPDRRRLRAPMVAWLEELSREAPPGSLQPS